MILISTAIANTKPRFDRKALVKLIIPLILEQFLLITVGMADTVMVASVGEAAVSGISLVDQINNLLIQLFAALAAGGAVVTAQYIGKGEFENAGRSAKQLVYASLIISLAIGAIAITFNSRIIDLIYGSIDADVHANAVTDFPIYTLFNQSQL